MSMEHKGIDIGPLLRPRSIAIFGMSSRPGSAGQIILRQIMRGGFEGPIHLVGRSEGIVEGLLIQTDPATLPQGIDLAILTMPAEVLEDTLRICVAKGIKSAVSFASGFAETGEEGRRAQEVITTIARDAGMALLGPNTVGYYNFVTGLTVMMIDQASPPPLTDDAGMAVAVVAQSGGIANHLLGSLRARGVPLSYGMTTGNEAMLDVAALADAFLDDDRTRVIAAYSEQIGAPQAFLALGAKARALGKAVVLLHPGRTSAGQAAASSHTGSMAGNYQAMEHALANAGILLVETQEELIDAAELLLHNPVPKPGGMALLTTSGALCALTADYLDGRGLTMPELATETCNQLKAILPDYLSAKNPLDLGTLPAWQPEMIGAGAQALLADPGIGCLIVSLPLTDADRMMAWLEAFAAAHGTAPAPAIFVLAGEDCPLPPALTMLAAASGIVVMRSNERAVRAMAAYQRHAGNLARAGGEKAPTPSMAIDLPALGAMAEWAGKQALASLGLAVPRGGLAHSADEAVAIAARIGFPVVMKAQAPDLMHKSDAGGVLLSIGDEAGVRAAYGQLHANVAAALPNLALDGVLVEAMGKKGIELVIGATRDPQWGPLVLVGLGGIWVEALHDVRLISPGLTRAEIEREILQLRAARLLTGFRGAPPVDLAALVDVVELVGNLMLAQPSVAEIDINPLVALPQGEGAVALDVLVVTR